MDLFKSEVFQWMKKSPPPGGFVQRLAYPTLRGFLRNVAKPK
jgi:hypothetical protein